MSRAEGARACAATVMDGVADFRSDTVTRPNAAMRRAMAEAIVGDDVFGDDPTVKDLERRTAQLFEKEEALFLPSGTMANQVAIRCHCAPGDEVLLHEGCHVYRFEQGGLAALHGVQSVPLPGDGGMVPIDVLEASIRPDDPHFARSCLVVVENTHNLSGGRVLALTYIDAIADFVKSRRLKLHLDGARLMNAAITLGVSAARLARGADSVTLCLSKGLGAPVGTMLAGDGPFMARARRARKLLGGGMRQAGVLAAAGILALEEGPAQLSADHRRAQELAVCLSGLEGVHVTPPETNIVVLSVPGLDVPAILDAWRRDGVLAVAFGAGRLRLVTHHDVGDGDVARAVDSLARILSAARDSRSSGKEAS